MHPITPVPNQNPLIPSVRIKAAASLTRKNIITDKKSDLQAETMISNLSILTAPGMFINKYINPAMADTETERTSPLSPRLSTNKVQKIRFNKIVMTPE